MGSLRQGVLETESERRGLLNVRQHVPVVEGSSSGVSFNDCVTWGKLLNLSGLILYLHGSLPPLQESAPKTSALSSLVWVGPGTKGPVRGCVSGPVLPAG